MLIKVKQCDKAGIAMVGPPSMINLNHVSHIEPCSLPGRKDGFIIVMSNNLVIKVLDDDLLNRIQKAQGEDPIFQGA